MAHYQTAKPITLNCGLTLPNRLAKAAMAEGMADEKGLPGRNFQEVYGKWAEGGWGILITGNVQVDPKYLGAAPDVTINPTVPYNNILAAWKSWAESCSREGAPTIVQINHPGRQSPIGAGTRGLFEKNIAPSAIALNFGSGLTARLLSSLIFGTPREMTIEEIHDVVIRFASTAQLAAEAGFAGIEIHAAHGYLLAQFLSENSNKRIDQYGGSPTARAKIVVDIIHAVRAAVPKGFCVGIKLNSADHQSPAELSACIEQLKLITDAGVDFIEISGGSYENPVMTFGTESNNQQPSSRTVAREAFFLEFAKEIRKDFPTVPLMVTGGFRSRRGMETALENGDCDIIGLARPSVLDPSLPTNIIINPTIDDQEAIIHTEKIRPPRLAAMIGVHAIGAGAENTWYKKKLQEMGKK